MNGTSASLAATTLTWVAEVVNTTSGYTYDLRSASSVAVSTTTASCSSAAPEAVVSGETIASGNSGVVRYQVTVTLADGTVLVTNPVMA